MNLTAASNAAEPKAAEAYPVGSGEARVEAVASIVDGAVSFSFEAKEVGGYAAETAASPKQPTALGEAPQSHSFAPHEAGGNLARMVVVPLPAF